MNANKKLYFWKILERLIYNGILDFFNRYKIMNKYQFGFRNKNSTYIALIVFLEILL